MNKRLVTLSCVLLLWVACAFSQGNGIFKFKGKIGGQFPIVMELSATASSAWGSYYYVSQGPKKKLDLSGEVDLNSESDIRWIIKEEVNGKFNGVFILDWDRLSSYSTGGYKTITGLYINVKKQQFSVDLKCYKADHYYGGYGK